MKKLIVLVAAMAMVATFAMSAAAADWNFYGNARVATFMVDSDTGPLSDKDFDHGAQGNARIGANIKVSDELTGRFELGLGADGGISTRLLYGTWNFGPGKLTVGHFWTPVNWFFSSQAYGGDNGMLTYGMINNLRQAGVEVAFSGFKLAFIQPSENATSIATAAGVDLTTAVGAVDTAAAPATFNETDTSIPKIEASYTYNIEGGHFLKVVGGYNTYEIDAATFDADIDSWVVGLSGKFVFGPASIAAGYWQAQNNDTYRAGYFTQSGLAPMISALGTVTDIEEMGYAVVLGFKANDMFSFEVGYAFCETEYDTTGSNKDKVSTYYVQSTITLAPGVFVIPEIGVFDGDEAGDTEILYYGMKWQINF